MSLLALADVLGYECTSNPNTTCTSYISGFQCSDIQKVANTNPTTFCSQAQSLVNFANAPSTAVDINTIALWYQNVFAPCVENTCSATPTPVTAEQLNSVPTTLFKSLLESQLPKKDLFVLNYGLYIMIAMLVLIVVLVIAVIVKK